MSDLPSNPVRGLPADADVRHTLFSLRRPRYLGRQTEVDVGIDELFGTNRQQVLEIAARHGAKNVRIFGSVARGTATTGSDVDVLVTMEEGRSLLDLCALGNDLEDLLQRKVDVVSDRGLSPYMREDILSEAIPL